MSTQIVAILNGYLADVANTSPETVTGNIADDAKALGISAGTLSLLRNGRPLTDRVIEKIAAKLSRGNNERKKQITKELQDAKQSSADDSLDAFHKFFETRAGEKRLICISYRDIPQSRDTGSYPGYVDRSAAVIRDGLSCAMFQVFGPISEIKKKVKTAYDRDDVGKVEIWSFIYQLAIGVHEVFGKMKKLVSQGKGTGQIALYEAATVPSLAVCDINSRFFFSLEESEKNTIRIAQLIRGREDGREHFIECTSEPGYQSATASQFHPVIQYWRQYACLPLKQSELLSYYARAEECPWRICAS